MEVSNEVFYGDFNYYKDNLVRNYHKTVEFVKAGIVKNAEAQCGTKLSTPCLVKLDIIQNIIFELKREGVVDEQNRHVEFMQCY